MTGISQVDIIKNSVQKSSSFEIDDINKHTITDSTIENHSTVCAECGNNHSFSGNFEGAITFIDMLPELFPEIFISNNLQEFVN